MRDPMQLDEFLKAQGSGFTATLEAIPDKPTHVRVTPFRDGHDCGCAGSFELPREAIRSVTGTGQFHFCCGKRLQVAIVEFAENASVPVADLMKQKEDGYTHTHDHGPDAGREHMGHSGPRGYPGAAGHGGRGGHGGYGGYSGYARPAFARSARGGGPPPPPPFGSGGGPVGLVGRWRIPWSRCSVSCIEVCTRFCSDTGWDCCEWETRCALNCDGPYWDPLDIFF